MMTGLTGEIGGASPPMTERRLAASRIKRTGMSLIVAALAVTAFDVPSAMARNQWDKNHWEIPKDATHLTINVNNCQNDPDLYDYDTFDHFSEPNDDWRVTIGNAGGAITIDDGGDCPDLSTPTDPVEALFGERASDNQYYATSKGAQGTVNAFISDYGNTGWVGVAIVALDDSTGDNHIVYGEVHLNDYYPKNYDIYNTLHAMQKIQCQELGHIFGLDHIKKDQSCMYMSMIFLGLENTPNNHDGEMVNKITDRHDAGNPPPDDDSGDGSGPGGGGGGGDAFCVKNPDHRRCPAPAPSVFRGKATWAEGYESRDDMFEAADVVVSVRVLNGSMFDRVVGAYGRGLPVSQAVMQIQETFKGNANGVIRIEHTRGLGLEIEDDPGYVNGDDYLLYLRQVGARTFRVVNPQGRIPQ